MSKPSESFICPRCKLTTIEAVQKSEFDFLAIHKVVRGLVKSSATGKEIECMVLVRSCSTAGETNRTDFVEVLKVKTAGKKLSKIQGVKERENLSIFFGIMKQTNLANTSPVGLQNRGTNMSNHPLFVLPPKTRRNGKYVLNAWLDWQENWLNAIAMMQGRMDEGY